MPSTNARAAGDSVRCRNQTIPDCIVNGGNATSNGTSVPSRKSRLNTDRIAPLTQSPPRNITFNAG